MPDAPIAAGPIEASVGSDGFEFYWLVELFHRGGNSLGRYHTGLTDLHNQSRSTLQPHEAMRYSKANAERIADALNVHMMACEWRAVEHGFATTSDALRGALMISARRVKVLEEALRRLTFAARTSGGWEPDADLREACERAERLLPDVPPNVFYPAPATPEDNPQS